MDPEKGSYAIDSAPKDEYDHARRASAEVDVRRGSIVLGEAKEVYGSAEEAERMRPINALPAFMLTDLFPV